MGSQCSTLRRDKSKEAEYYKPNQKKGEVSSTVQSGEESYLLQRRPSVQEEGGAVKEIREEGTLRKQEDEDTVSATLGCSETSSSLARECTVAERNTTRWSCISVFMCA